MIVTAKDFPALIKAYFPHMDEDLLYVGDYSEEDLPEEKPIFVLQESPVDLVFLATPMSENAACEIYMGHDEVEPFFKEKQPLYREVWRNENPHEGPVVLEQNKLAPKRIEPFVQDDIFSREDQRKLIHHFL